MVIGIILTLILILLIIYISFKIGKTIVKTLLTLVVLTIVLLGLFAGLVYVDYKYYSSNIQKVALVYELDNSYIQLAFNRGVNIDLSNVFKVLNKNYNFKEESEKNNILYIVIPKEFFEKKLIPETLTFNIPNKAKKDIKVTLTKQQILDTLKGNYNKTYDKVIQGNITNESLINGTDNKISRLNFRELTTLFLTQNIMSDNKKVLLIIDAYKNNTVKVYPERESLKILKKILPASSLESIVRS